MTLTTFTQVCFDLSRLVIVHGFANYPLCLWLIDGVVEARSTQTRGRLPLRKLKCKEQQKEAVEQGKTVFQARVTENSPLGYYTIETIIDGKVLRGVLLSNRHHSSVQTADPSSTSRQVCWL